MNDERKKRFLQAFAESRGIVLTACEATGISRSTYYKWMKDDPDFKAAASDVAEAQLDFVESKLINRIDSGDTTAIIFYLKTKGKKRGYIEKTQPKDEARPTQPHPTLPDTDDTAERKRIERRVKSKRDYIVRLLKKQGKYTAELTYQVDITAQLLVRADILGEEMLHDGHSPVNVEYSREGNERMTLNPKERLYLDVLSQGQRALRALGMNNDGKERHTDSDTFSDFMEAMKGGDE